MVISKTFFEGKCTSQVLASKNLIWVTAHVQKLKQITPQITAINILCSGSKFKSQHINATWVTYAVNTLEATLWFQQSHFQMA